MLEKFSIFILLIFELTSSVVSKLPKSKRYHHRDFEDVTLEMDFDEFDYTSNELDGDDSMVFPSDISYSRMLPVLYQMPTMQMPMTSMHQVQAVQPMQTIRQMPTVQMMPQRSMVSTPLYTKPYNMQMMQPTWPMQMPMPMPMTMPMMMSMSQQIPNYHYPQPQPEPVIAVPPVVQMPMSSPPPAPTMETQKMYIPMSYSTSMPMPMTLMPEKKAEMPKHPQMTMAMTTQHPIDQPPKVYMPYAPGYSHQTTIHTPPKITYYTSPTIYRYPIATTSTTTEKPWVSLTNPWISLYEKIINTKIASPFSFFWNYKEVQ